MQSRTLASDCNGLFFQFHTQTALGMPFVEYSSLLSVIKSSVRSSVGLDPGWRERLAYSFLLVQHTS